MQNDDTYFVKKIDIYTLTFTKKLLNGNAPNNSQLYLVHRENKYNTHKLNKA